MLHQINWQDCMEMQCGCTKAIAAQLEDLAEKVAATKIAQNDQTQGRSLGKKKSKKDVIQTGASIHPAFASTKLWFG